ncbi:hypothetical protein Gotur_029291 [Gossypium turneri]
MIVWLHPIYPGSAMRGGGGSRLNKRGKSQLDWRIKHQKFVALWNDRMGRRPQMVMVFDLQPSLKYIQWYYSCGKPYILGGQSTVVPPHMQRPGGSYQATPME